MMTNYLPFSDTRKIKQFIVQFAFRIPIRKELTSGEKKALGNVLKELDNEYFQLFEDPSIKNPATLFQVVHQVPLGPGTVTLPSFVFSNNSFSFIWLVHMFGKFLSNFTSFDTQKLNKKMVGWTVKVQNVISNLNCHRTGKIYEMVLGPFTQSEKENIFQELFSINLANVGEVNLTFAKYIESENFVYNIQTNINYMQQSVNQDFFIRVRVDINNRQLETSIEPAVMEKVWNFADAKIYDHLKELLKT